MSDKFNATIDGNNRDAIFEPSMDRGSVIRLRFPVNLKQVSEDTIEIIVSGHPMSYPFSEEFIAGLKEQIGTIPAMAWLEKHSDAMMKDLILGQVRSIQVS